LRLCVYESEEMDVYAGVVAESCAVGATAVPPRATLCGLPGAL